MQEIFSEQADGIQSVSSAIARVQSSGGADKAKAIDALYESTPEAGRKPLGALIRELPSLDPADTNKLAGKYEFISTYEDAIENMSEGIRDGVAESFINIAEKGHLSPGQKFEAYYNAAYIMALLGDSDYDKMHELLGKAQESDPENMRMEDVTNLMTMIAQMRDIMNQNDDAFSYPGASGD